LLNIALLILIGCVASPQDIASSSDDREDSNIKGNSKKLSKIPYDLERPSDAFVLDKDLKEISQYVNLQKTPMIISENIHYLQGVTWEDNRKQLIDVLTSWQSSWRNENLKEYTNHYHRTLFKDPVRGRYASFKAYKRNVFSNPGKPNIKFTNLSLLGQGSYVVATMVQEYHSNTVNDTGKKTLYLVKDKDYNWKIIHESWSKIDPKRDIAFAANINYFK